MEIRRVLRDIVSIANSGPLFERVIAQTDSQIDGRQKMADGESTPEPSAFLRRLLKITRSKATLAVFRVKGIHGRLGCGGVGLSISGASGPRRALPAQMVSESELSNQLLSRCRGISDAGSAVANAESTAGSLLLGRPFRTLVGAKIVF